MAKITDYAQQIIDRYSKLQRDILTLMIQAIKSSKLKEIDKSNVLAWQIEQLAKTGRLTSETIMLVAKANNESTADVKRMVSQLGDNAVASAKTDVSRYTRVTRPVSPSTGKLIQNFTNQATKSLNETATSSLLARNSSTNAAAKIYKDIVNESVVDISSGAKTYEQAIFDNIYDWVDNGLPTTLSDVSGRGWSLEGYSRMVVQTTGTRVVNSMRNATMKANDVTLALMSWHPCSRPACAPIQGHIVNMVPTEDPNYDGRYDSIYNHGYGEPGGTQGINCAHTFTPWDPDLNIHHADPLMPSPEDAIEQGKIQSQQRQMERAIRQTKNRINAAQTLGDKPGISKFNSTLANQQANVRKLVSAHDYLNRDYTREKVANK